MENFEYVFKEVWGKFKVFVVILEKFFIFKVVYEEVIGGYSWGRSLRVDYDVF